MKFYMHDITKSLACSRMVHDCLTVWYSMHRVSLFNITLQIRRGGKDIVMFKLVIKPESLPKLLLTIPSHEDKSS